MLLNDLVAWGKVLAGNWLVQQAMRLDSVRVANSSPEASASGPTHLAVDAPL